MEDGRLMQSMLLDFYGELLTPKQRECYDLHYNDDLSLAEIAVQLGISRQGVWDNIRRAESSLQDIEEKTGLIRRFSRTQQSLDKLLGQMERLKKLCSGEALEIAGDAATQIETMRLEV